MREIPAYALDLRLTVNRAADTLSLIDEEQAARPPAPGKWSPKEIIGHLIDSACNNHRRFVTAPAKDDLVFEGYEQESWVEIQQYRQADWKSLLALWKAYNLHLSYVMQTIPAEIREKKFDKHSLQKMAWNTLSEEEPATLDYLMEDYVGHLRHHLRQIGDILGYTIVGR